MNRTEVAAALSAAASSLIGRLGREFELERHEDPSGISGTGVVADGVQFGDGTVVLHWHGEHPSTAVWPSIEQVLATHGHNGLTVCRWLP